MNLVELIEGHLKGETIDKLSTLTGESETKTRSAVDAVVPSLLAGLSGLASSGGAQKLVSALSNVTRESHGDPSAMLSGLPGPVLEKGNNLLGSLFGGGAVSNIVGALSKYTGIGTAGVKTLLGYVTPVALAAIGGEYFKGKAPTAQDLSAMFAEQKGNITHALPTGLSLDNVPGLAASEPAYKTPAAAEAVREPAVSSPELPGWVVPAIAIAILAAILWFALRPSPTNRVTTPSAPVVPAAGATAAQLSQDLTGVISGTTTTLSSITDASSAEAALPQLQDLNTRLDSVQSGWSKLPDSVKASLGSMAGNGMGKIKELATSVEAIPGASEKVKPVIDQILSKLSAMGT